MTSLIRPFWTGFLHSFRTRTTRIGKRTIFRRKSSCSRRASARIPRYTRQLLYAMNSSGFLQFLERLTGIQNLLGDPQYEGGGLHQIVPGGKLAIHADFSKHSVYNLDRRLNALVYLNKNWKEEYGGHLELWDTAMTKAERRIAPVFNRMVIFTTRQQTPTTDTPILLPVRPERLGSLWRFITTRFPWAPTQVLPAIARCFKPVPASGFSLRRNRWRAISRRRLYGGSCPAVERLDAAGHRGSNLA